MACICEVDRDLGRRLRELREAKGLSQEKLAREIGVVFQQIQKYEAGINRISCSRLLQILSVLNISIVDFFIGIENNSHLVINEDEVLLLRAYRAQNENIRQAIVTLLALPPERDEIL